MTGPYHTIYSLNKILKNYNDHLYAVKINKNKFLKKMASFLSYPKENQPLLCTFVKKKIKGRVIKLYCINQEQNKWFNRLSPWGSSFKKTI